MGLVARYRVLLGPASRMEMRVEPQLVAECLVRGDCACENRPTRGLVVELHEDIVDQTGHLGEQASVVAEERPECLGHGEYELAMRQLENNLIGQMLREQDGPFSTTGGLVTHFVRCSPMHPGTEVESLAGERPEVVMAAFGVGTTDTRHALEIVTARREPLAELLDTLQAVSTVGGRVLLLVVLAELGEVSLEYSMELVAPTGNVPVRRRRRNRDCSTHINIYWGKVLPASDTWLFHRSPHNVAHSPDTFSELSLLRGRR